MKYSIVGTAGHVDHGKTRLVKALTGQDTDRLEQEKLRGISIELGFASMKLPGGSTLAFIDVPGHERFIRQMLAGAGGIDFFLLVVAADEGIKNQTREHMEILHLLDIHRGVVAVTKIDLVTGERVEQVRSLVGELLESMGFSQVSIVGVSAETGEGVEALVKALEDTAAGIPPKLCDGKMVMPIDRVFSLKGVGTVLTGTLWSGKITVGDRLEVLPGALECRVRGLQEHGEAKEEIPAGHRAAVNITGIEMENIKRGNIIQTPGFLKPSSRADIYLDLLPTAKKPLRNGERVRFYHGTAEYFGKVILLDREEIPPGEQGYAQCVPETPLVAAPNHRMIIRTYSPMYTIGGATVISTGAPKRKRFNDDDVLAVTLLHTGTAGEKLEIYLNESETGLLPLTNAAELVSMRPQEVEALSQGDGTLRGLQVSGEKYVTSLQVLLWLEQILSKALQDYHKKYPLRPGMPKEELRSARFSLFRQGEWQGLLAAMESMGALVVEGETVRLPGFAAGLGPKQQVKAQQIEARLLANPFQPLLWSLISRELFYFNPQEGEEIRRYLQKTGVIVEVSDDLFFHKDAISRARELIREYILEHGSITSGQARDLLGSSRKFVIPLLEYLDAQGFTVRKGNERFLQLGK